MKKLILLACVLIQLSAHAQVKIGENPTNINGGSLLELESNQTSPNGKGFVPPRVALTALSSTSPLPAGIITGTLVFNTNSGVGSGAGLYYWNGLTWTAVGTNAITNNAWTVIGNAGTDTTNNFLGTIGNTYFNIKTFNKTAITISPGGNVNIGLPSNGLTNYKLGVSNSMEIKNSDATAGGKGSIISQFLFTNSNGINGADVRLANDGGELILQTGGGRNTELATYWTLLLSGDRGVGTTPAYTYGNHLSDPWLNTGVLARAQRTASVPFAIQGISGQTANLTEWRDASSVIGKTLSVVDASGKFGIGITAPPNMLSVLGTNPLYLSGVQPTATLTTDSLLTINAGVVKKVAYPTLQAATNAWSLIGNTGTTYTTNFLGTADNVSLRMRTNNLQRMIIDSLGNVGIGSEAFGTTNRERLLVDMGTATSHTIATYTGTVNDYMQVNVKNKSTGINASSDYVATANDGTDDTLYIDMGINGSGFAPGVENWGNAHDAYLYANARNLLIGTQAGPQGDVIFLVGGGRINTNAAMRITQGSNNVVIGNGDSTTAPAGNILRGPNATGSSNIAGGTLTVQGGASRGTTKGGRLNLFGGGSGGTGLRGAINMSGDSLYYSGIPTTASVTTDSVLVISNTAVKKAPYSSFSGGGGGSNDWSILGNSNTASSTNFVGTTNDVALVFKTNGLISGFIGSTNDGLGRTSLGQAASAGDQNATALGRGANASANQSTALGYSSSATQQNALAIGINANAAQSAAIAVGFGAIANAQQSIAIGNAANASNSVNNIAIGTSAAASVQNGIAIGPNAKATNQLTAMALGNNANAGGQSSTAIGDGAAASAASSLAIGVSAAASGSNAIAIGNGAVASQNDATAYGTGAQATATSGNAFGNSSLASGVNSLVIGDHAIASGLSTIAIGDNSTASAGAAIAIGNSAKAQAQGNIVIGAASSITNVSATNSLIFGSNSKVSANDVILIGNNITGAGQANALILGGTNVNVGVGTTTPNTSTRLDVAGPVKLGTAGTVLNGVFRTTITLDPGSIAIGSTVVVTATITGLSQNATVTINPQSNLTGGAIIAWVRASAANTISVGFTGSGLVVDPASAVYDVTVIQ